MHDLTMQTDRRDDRAVPDTAQLSESDRHRLLAAERRRTALEVLEDRPAPTALEDLAEAVAERECEAGSPAPELVDGVAVSLHHSHLPKMAALDVLEYDTDAHRIE